MLSRHLELRTENKVPIVTPNRPRSLSSTGHPNCRRTACLDPYWGTHPVAAALNPYFINDLDIKGFKLWIAGHTHTSVDTVVDGCRLVINPLGYPPEQGKNGFRENLIIEV